MYKGKVFNENTLYLVLDSVVKNEKYSLFEIAEMAIKGGVDVVQLRDKVGNSRLFYEEAVQIKGICRKYNVPFIVNDRVDIAMAVQADGVHIGRKDIPLPTVRSIAEDMIIGWSAYNIEEAKYGEKNGACYLGVGVIFNTNSKSDVESPIGIEGLSKIARETNLPVIAIGGINENNAKSCIDAGAVGVAVISAITLKDDITAAARNIKESLK